MTAYKWVTNDFRSFANGEIVYEKGTIYKRTFVFTTIKSAAMYIQSDACSLDNKTTCDMVLLKGIAENVMAYVGPECKHGDVEQYENEIAFATAEFIGDFQWTEVIRECTWKEHERLEKLYHKAANRKQHAAFLNDVLREWGEELCPEKSYKERDKFLSQDHWYWCEEYHKPVTFFELREIRRK